MLVEAKMREGPGSGVITASSPSGDASGGAPDDGGGCVELAPGAAVPAPLLAAGEPGPPAAGLIADILTAPRCRRRCGRPRPGCDGAAPECCLNWPAPARSACAAGVSGPA